MAHAGKFFGVFQRLHRAEDFDGTGVGLAVAQRIVHRHGGVIWAKASPGAGATFLFTLDGDRAMNAVEIMLVEDNPDDLELTVRALRKSNFTNPIRVLRDGAEALDYLFGQRSRTAAQHGDGAGRDAARSEAAQGQRRRGTAAGQERPAHQDHSGGGPDLVARGPRPEETYKLGANSYIVKPVDFEQFNRAVNQIGMYWLLINQHPPGKTPGRSTHARFC